ncbi:MAG: hypothetical protein ACLSWI_07080, partial [Candidatus Gastranaerophilaceae bacterium]
SEVLITLGIIGIVAALTMSSLINNANDRKYRGARQKALATIGGAVRNITVTEGIGNAVDAEDFVDNHLRKQIQIVKTCKNNDLRSCGIETDSNAITTLTEPKKKMTIPTKIGDLANGISSGKTIDVNSTSYGFVMSNGYSVNLFYNPNCMGDNKVGNHWGQDRVCVNAVYDMNGLARPNEVGKDIGFVTVIYPDITSIAVAPDVYNQYAGVATFDRAAGSCQVHDKELSVPNRDELLSMYYNMNLLGISARAYWSASEAPEELGWDLDFRQGNRHCGVKTSAYALRCIRR